MNVTERTIESALNLDPKPDKRDTLKEICRGELKAIVLELRNRRQRRALIATMDPDELRTGQFLIGVLKAISDSSEPTAPQVRQPSLADVSTEALKRILRGETG